MLIQQGKMILQKSDVPAILQAFKGMVEESCPDCDKRTLTQDIADLRSLLSAILLKGRAVINQNAPTQAAPQAPTPTGSMAEAWAQDVRAGGRTAYEAAEKRALIDEAFSGGKR